MSPILIAILGILISAMALKVTEHRLSTRKSLPYDVNKVREMEQDIWGMTFTPAPESKPVSAAAPMHKLNDRAKELQVKAAPIKVKPRPEITANKANNCTCSRCDTPKYSDDICQKCPKMELEKRRYEREKAKSQPRIRYVDFYGKKYRVLMPTEVPDGAFCEITVDPRSNWHWAHFKWTDPKTGATKGLKSSAQEAEAVQIESGNGNIVKRFYA